MIGDSRKSQEGFTLIELLIATAVISVVMVAATALLLSVFRSQREARETLFLQDQARYVTQLISERLHNGVIDYDWYAGAPMTQPELLAIRTTEGVQTVFRFQDRGNGPHIFVCDGKQYDDSCDVNDDADWSQLTPSTTQLLFGQFDVFPDVSPYFGVDAAPPSNISPLVTIRLQLQMVESAHVAPLIQTAFTPRYYVR